MADLVIHSARVITATGDGEVRDDIDAWVRVTDGIVENTGTGAPPEAHTVIDARTIAGAGGLLTPGLVDIHNHGGAGHTFGQQGDSPAAAVGAHARHGVTRVVASLVSAPADVLSAQIDALSRATNEVPGLIGIHLEGPCLAPGHRGAHDPASLVEPSAVDLVTLCRRGPVVQVTLAPELAGAETAIAQLLASGAAVAVGHTGADMATAAAAFRAGASILTHTFNAMAPLHHRHPGPVGAAIADPAATLEIIADGHHVAPVVVATLFRAAAGRIALVSDAMAAAADEDGAYRLGGLDVTVVDGRATLTGTDVIAGSTLTLDRALRNAVAWGVPLCDAVAAATHTPARAIGRPDLGRLAPGARADLVLWSDDLHPRAVWRDGQRVDA